MARKKRRAAKVGAKAGARLAPVAGRTAGKAAWKLGKAEAKLIRRAMSSQEPKKSRYLKYGFFALLGLAVGAAIARSKKGETPDETWGSGTSTGTAGDGGQQGPGVPTAPAPSGTTRTPRPDLLSASSIATWRA